MDKKVSTKNLGGWILRCNPDQYDLPGRVRDGFLTEYSWRVAANYRTNEVMAPGQRVILWLGGSGRGNAVPGIWGVGHVTGYAYDSVANNSDYWRDADAAGRLRQVVDIDVTIRTPIPKVAVRAVPELASMELFTAQQQSNPIFVSNDEMTALEALIGSWPAYPGEQERITVSASGAGYGDPTTNKLVEQAAMQITTAYYESRGWQGHDVSAEKCGWDITFSKPGLPDLHVEVKGVSGTRLAFLITRGELETAKKDELWRLVVVAEALTSTPRIEELTRDEVVQGCEPHVYRFRR